MKPKTICMFALAVAAAVFAAPAVAGEGSTKPSSQQSRFAACAHESKGLKGEEHHHFMSQCLKGNGASDVSHRKEASQHKAAAEGSQQSKMKTCNDAAGKKNLHGDERRSFMSTCLRG